MARTALAVQSINKNAGLAQATPNGADQANGNSFINDGQTVLVIKNGDVVARTATINSANAVACSHGRTAQPTVVVAAGDTALFGPFDKAGFNQSDGTIQLDWSAGTTAAVKVSPVSVGN